MRKWIGVGAVTLAMLAGGAIWARAQREPEVLTGNDFGFQIERWSPDGTPVGKIVVRHEGKWVEVRIPISPRRATVK